MPYVFGYFSRPCPFSQFLRQALSLLLPPGGIIDHSGIRSGGPAGGVGYSFAVFEMLVILSKNTSW
jgi:hypothetical protein